MRKIKFRGKRKDNGEFIYGSLIINSHMGVITYHIATDGLGKIYATSYEISPKTLGQYTGMLDISGIEIYESDTVQTVQRDRLDEPWIGKVVWENFSWQIEGAGMLCNFSYDDLVII